MSYLSLEPILMHENATSSRRRQETIDPLSFQLIISRCGVTDDTGSVTSADHVPGLLGTLGGLIFDLLQAPYPPTYGSATLQLLPNTHQHLPQSVLPPRSLITQRMLCVKSDAPEFIIGTRLDQFPFSCSQ